MTDDQAYFESKGFQKILKKYEESAKSARGSRSPTLQGS